MKKTLRIVMLACMTILFTLPFASCSDDKKSADEPTTGNIVGSWRAEQINDAGLPTENKFTDVLTFNSNGTGSRVRTITYTSSGSSTNENFNFRYTVATATNGIMTITIVDVDNYTSMQWSATQTGNTLICNNVIYTRI